MEEKTKRFIKALYYAKEKGLFNTQQELVDKMGTTKSSFSAAKRGDPSYLTNNFLLKFNQALDGVFHLPWLLGGTGTMLGTDEVAMQAKSVPLIDASSIGGALQNIAVDGITPEECEMVYTPVEDAEAAIGVFGDSMAPTYPSGSRVFIRKIDMESFIPWGSVFVLNTVNGIYIKEVRKGSDDEHILCVSHNQEERYEPFEIPLDSIYNMWIVIACVTVHQ